MNIPTCGIESPCEIGESVVFSIVDMLLHMVSECTIRTINCGTLVALLRTVRSDDQVAKDWEDRSDAGGGGVGRSSTR